MWRTFCTLRFAFLFVTCLGGGSLWLDLSPHPRLEKTGNGLDLAIVGSGYFPVTNESGDVYYTRSGKLVVDSNYQLGMQQDGKFWLLEPPIILPNDWTRLIVTQDGMLSVAQASGGPSSQIGALQLASFAPSEPFAQPLSVNRPNEQSGTALLSNPPMGGTIYQGWLEQPGNPNRKAVGQWLVASLATSVIVNLLWQIAAKKPAP